MKKFIGTVIVGSLAWSSIASAEPPAKKAQDPNRVICRTEGNTGSRVNSSKRCMTAEQWAEMKRQNQLDIERVQAVRWKND